MEETKHLIQAVDGLSEEIVKDTIRCPGLPEEESPESDRGPVEYLHLKLARRLTD